MPELLTRERIQAMSVMELRIAVAERVMGYVWEADKIRGYSWRRGSLYAVALPDYPADIGLAMEVLWHARQGRPFMIGAGNSSDNYTCGIAGTIAHGATIAEAICRAALCVQSETANA